MIDGFFTIHPEKGVGEVRNSGTIVGCSLGFLCPSVQRGRFHLVPVLRFMMHETMQHARPPGFKLLQTQRRAQAAFIHYQPNFDIQPVPPAAASPSSVASHPGRPFHWMPPSPPLRIQTLSVSPDVGPGVKKIALAT